MIVRKSRIKQIISYLIGLLAVQNVIYVFKISNTYINIELFLGFISIMFLMMFDRKALFEALRKTDKSLKWYLLSIVLSFLFLINYAMFNQGTRIISFFNGLISLFLSLSVYYSVIVYRRYRLSIVKGLWHGLIINTIVSILQLVMFNIGSYFSLYDWFPEEFYYVSIKWGMPGTVHLSDIQEWLIYSYRASGLYLECSYFVASMTCVLIICWSYRKAKIVDYFLLFVLTILISMSGSGNLVIYVAILLMYFSYTFISKININRYFGISKYSVFIIVGALLVIAFAIEEKYIDLTEIISGIEESVLGVNISDEGNNERLTFMIAAFHFYLTYPIGVGYNMASNALRAYSSTYAAFNYFLTVLIELGPIGLLAYLNLWQKNITGVIKNIELPRRAIFIGLLAAIFFQFANGTGFTHIVWVLLGLSQAERIDKKDRVVGTQE